LEAISFGLCAALAWGIHDILVRYVSQKLGILISLFSVLMFGAIAQTLMVGIFGRPSNVSTDGLLLSAAAGGVFSIACIGHYKAFQHGPVRLVAPVIGCYAALAFIIAAIAGKPVLVPQWIALVVLIFGIALVARSSENNTDAGQHPDEKAIGKTLMYCFMAMVGFAITFELGQRASAIDDPLSSSLITRSVTIMIIGVILWLQVKKQNGPFIGPDRSTLFVLAGMGILDAIALGVVLAAGIFPRPEFASAASSIFGLVTVILAWFFMREKINLVQWSGIAAVFAAIAYLASA
jgi:drug/metabolite transporter (DMT)-like permease